jgi:DNA-binding MurR/RpiR family transcriptional regulator
MFREIEQALSQIADFIFDEVPTAIEQTVDEIAKEIDSW